MLPTRADHDPEEPEETFWDGINLRVRLSSPPSVEEPSRPSSFQRSDIPPLLCLQLADPMVSFTPEEQARWRAFKEQVSVPPRPTSDAAPAPVQTEKAGEGSGTAAASAAASGGGAGGQQASVVQEAMQALEGAAAQAESENQ